MQERKLFDEKFIRLDTRRLCELTSAADALDMKPLVDLTSRALARMIEGKSADEIRSALVLIQHIHAVTTHLEHYSNTPGASSCLGLALMHCTPTIL